MHSRIIRAAREGSSILEPEDSSEASGRKRGPLTGTGLVWTGALLFVVGGLMAIVWNTWEHGLPERSPKTPGVIRATLEIAEVAGHPPRIVRSGVDAIDEGKPIGVTGRWERVDIPGPRLVTTTLHKIGRERGVAVASSAPVRLSRRGFDDGTFFFVLAGQPAGEYEAALGLVDPNAPGMLHEIARKRFRVQQARGLRVDPQRDRHGPARVGRTLDVNLHQVGPQQRDETVGTDGIRRGVARKDQARRLALIDPPEEQMLAHAHPHGARAVDERSTDRVDAVLDRRRLRGERRQVLTAQILGLPAGL